MSGSQCVSCLLVDVGSGTCASGSFPSISHGCLSFLSNRFASDPKHIAAVISYGSENTHNALAEASESATAYAHVEVLRAFLPIDWQLLTELRDALKPGGKPSDPLDACIVATDLYEKTFAKQLGAKKVRNDTACAYRQNHRCREPHAELLTQSLRDSSPLYIPQPWAPCMLLLRFLLCSV